MNSGIDTSTGQPVAGIGRNATDEQDPALRDIGQGVDAARLSAGISDPGEDNLLAVKLSLVCKFVSMCHNETHWTGSVQYIIELADRFLVCPRQGWESGTIMDQVSRSNGIAFHPPFTWQRGEV